MASATSSHDLSTLVENLLSLRSRGAPLFFPYFPGFSIVTQLQEPEDAAAAARVPSDQHPERVVLINPFSQSMIVIGNSDSPSTGIDSFLDDFLQFSEKKGRPPASEASIDSLKTVEISGEDEIGGDPCVVCLEEWGIGDKAKEMPCNHRFHKECVEKWLKIHGSCPVCRYEMPADEEGKRKSGGDGDGVRSREVWLSFMVGAGTAGSNERRNE